MGVRTSLTAVVAGVVSITLAAGFLAPATRAAITTPYAEAGRMPIAQSVRHEWGTLVTGAAQQQHINVLQVDPADPTVDVRLSQAGGIATARAVVTDQAHAYGDEQRRVVGTVNGSTFFYLRDAQGLQIGGTAIGLNVSDGEVINAGPPAADPRYLTFGMRDDGTPQIGYADLEMTLTMPSGATIDLGRVNQRRRDTDIVLLTPRYDTHTGTDDLGDEYVVEGFDLPLRTTGSYSGTVVAAFDNDGDNPIEPGQVVISVGDGATASFETLAPGDNISLSISIDEPWRQVANSVGGRNPLVEDGQVVATSTTSRDPRTAVGIKADGALILVTADSGLADTGGMTLREMGQLMWSLGAVDAVNLDGGGSTQMGVRQPGAEMLERVTTLLTPPEAIRPVPNALQIVSSGPAIPDASAPVVDTPIVSLAPVDRVAKKQADLDIAWAVTDESVVEAVEVEADVGGAGWRALGPEIVSATAARLRVPHRQSLRVRVRATDEWGNTSEWVESDKVKPRVIDDGHRKVVRSAGWRRKPDSRFFSGAYRRSTTSAAFARLQFRALQVGLVGRVSPRGGQARVSIDGAQAGTVDTFAETADYRRLLYLGPQGDGSAVQRIEVRNRGSAARPMVEIDAFLLLEEAP